MRIGPHEISVPLIVAPMAGVTDRPFRQLCRQHGAGLAVSEMLTAKPELWHSRKSQFRLNHEGEIGPISVQIAGADPQQMAEAARFNVQHGADIIDINMGCPAKKVCNVAAGSALMQNEPLVARILQAVVQAVDVPVTLKIRTGWDHAHRNALSIARLAEEAGISALTIHGRTRADLYNGEAEYDTIRRVKAAVSLPVIANGDIDSPQRAARVLSHTGADALMIGRAAQGYPWIFREIAHFLATGALLAPPTLEEMRTVVLQHLGQLHAFYGEIAGVRIARKHLGWYVSSLPAGEQFRQAVVREDSSVGQTAAVEQFFDALLQSGAAQDAVEQATSTTGLQTTGMPAHRRAA